jgi:membrane protein DedA with SNARE-associated domain
MEALVEFLREHGYSVLFGWTLADQLGLPLPAIPVLLAAGALAGQGQLSLSLCIVLAAVACMLSDAIWYELGRHRGHAVLRLVCRLSMEPDYCVSYTTGLFERMGMASLLVGKFVPGLQTLVPPMAGMLNVSRSTFLALDFVGSALWAMAFLVPAFVFSDELARLGALLDELGMWFGVLLASLLLGYVGFKFWQRRHFLRTLEGRRMSAEELKLRMDRGEDLQIIDLRQRIEYNAFPHVIPDAIRVTPEAIEQDHHLIARDKEVVLYCT